MDKKRIVLLGTLDTKANQFAFLKLEISKRNCKPIILDVGMGGQPPFEGDVTASEIAQLAGKTIEEIRASKDRVWASEFMLTGARKKLELLKSEGSLDGIIALGGWSTLWFASNAMKGLPFGLPKLIICADVRSDMHKLFDLMDVAIMQALIDLSELNELTQDVLLRGAAAICSMAEKQPFALKSGKAIAMTEMGICEKCAQNVRKELVDAGFSVYSFHAAGVSDAVMESLIRQGHFDGVVDIASAGVIEELFEGPRAAGPRRLEAAGERGLAQVIAPSCINITNASPYRKGYEEYASRSRKIVWDEFRIATRYNTEELIEAARVYAEKVNRAKGPVKFLIPLRGWSSMDAQGSVLYAPEEDRVFVVELKRNLKQSIEVEELDCNLNDPEFAEAIVNSFKLLYQAAES